ncbi:MAG: LysR substrate-binding domain-containing protein [Pseudomonadota bacterium]
MRYSQLRAFHNVALNGGFSRAAEALGLTQPAISDQVKRLERDYDVLLIRRSSKQIVLTEAGERLLEVTHRLFDAEQQARDLLSESLSDAAGSIRIIADSALHILQTLGRFRARYPKVFISVRSGNSSEVIEALEAYDADVGITGEAPEGRAFQIASINTTPIIAFAGKDHPIAQQGTIRFADLVNYPLVLRERGSNTRAKIERHAAQLGLTLPIAIEAEGREAVREIVAAGGGIGVVSQAEFRADRRLKAIPFSDANLNMEESIVCLSDRSESRQIRNFMAMARAADRG